MHYCDIQQAEPGTTIPYCKRERICRYKGCNTILTGYNPGRYCFFHEQKKVWDEIKADDERLRRHGK